MKDKDNFNTLQNFRNSIGSYKKAFDFAISELYKGKTFNEIVLESNALPEEVMGIIKMFWDEVENKDFINSLVVDHYKSIKIPGNKIILTSDSHIGGNKEDASLIYDTYNHAINNKFNCVLNLGDVVEGFSNIELNKPQELKIQLKSLKNLIPPKKELITYYMYGNHEMNLLRHNFYTLIDDFELKNFIEYIGIEYSYLYWNSNKPIKLVHDCKNVYYSFNIDSDIIINGHSHQLNFYEEQRRLSLPPFTRAFDLNSPNGGFVEMYNESDEYIFNPIIIEKNGKIIRKEEIKVKKIK